MSTLRFDSWKSADNSKQFYGAIAWVSFVGTGTVTINASANVSSITDNGTGDYTANLTAAVPDTKGSAVATAGEPTGSNTASAVFATVSTVRIVTRISATGAVIDVAQVSMAAYR
jgi:hypothetical protein